MKKSAGPRSSWDWLRSEKRGQTDRQTDRERVCYSLEAVICPSLVRGIFSFISSSSVVLPGLKRMLAWGAALLWLGRPAGLADRRRTLT